MLKGRNKRKWKWIIIAIVVLAAIGAAGSNDSDTEPSEEIIQSASSEQAESTEAALLSDSEIIEDDVYNGSSNTVLGKRGSINAAGYDISYGETSDFETLCEKIDSLKDDYMYFTLDFCDGTGIVFTGCDTLMPTYGELDETKALVKTIGFLTKTNDGYAYEESSIEAETEPSTEFPKVIADDVDISFSDSVENDITGNWHLACVATTKDIQEYALDYHNSYFKSDDEIHAIINFTLNTTNKLAKITSDILDVTVYDYVDKEEQDAKVLFSGTLLANYQINVSTGEITQISLEPDVPEEPVPENAEPAADPVVNSTSAAQAEPEVQEAIPDTEMVWLSETGSKYHSVPNCGRMNPDKARQVSKTDAEASGYSACSKCH